ncbi:phytanoyl-CoA dioxygenase family protein [Micromonospora sp. 4G55]|uniref:phytanoyl-CoA dioxygenase family protein n=1 Tax=Micromonospora sp. 4G55 TaxID=2806102 RepID=UPI001A4B5B43|nr:phytanoyl-CoA dioxygenase family protein [Micromonospora sp. 4G55]MBM0255536.1 phytanoyl-CoA dioxygenase family protein [Micromonospora sp. 4G55]
MSDLARFFDAAGYVRLPNRLPAALVDRMRSMVDDQFARGVPPYRMNHRGEPCRLDALLERDEVFLEALRHEHVAAALGQILGPTVDVVLNRHNHATLNNSGDIPFRLHRDIQQWSQPLVAVFLYLEPATVKNGCTHVVPATHRLPYAGPQSGNGGGNWADEHDEYRHLIGQEVPLEMPAGGVLLLNCLCFHSVGRNLSGRSRCSAVFACRSSDELSQVEDPGVIRLFGQRRFLANSVLEVSGSLRKGSRAS